MPVQGLHLITPSAAVATGTGSSATINANGSVTFSTVTELELRGVFSADYDNYQIVCRMTSSTSDVYAIRMVSGSTPTSTTNFTRQLYDASGTTVAGSRSTSLIDATVGRAATTQPNGVVLFVYGPYLSQPTVGRSLTVDSTSSARIYDSAWSHNESSSFDGIKWYPGSGTQTGLIAVYGMRK